MMFTTASACTLTMCSSMVQHVTSKAFVILRCAFPNGFELRFQPSHPLTSRLEGGGRGSLIPATHLWWYLPNWTANSMTIQTPMVIRQTAPMLVMTCRHQPCECCLEHLKSQVLEATDLLNNPSVLNQACPLLCLPSDSQPFGQSLSRKLVQPSTPFF